jgi:hypothetical protein
MYSAKTLLLSIMDSRTGILYMTDLPLAVAVLTATLCPDLTASMAIV